MSKDTTQVPPVDVEAPSEYRNLRYDFSAVEVHELAVQLANKNQEFKRMEDEKKSAMARYKAQLDLISEEINSYSDKVASGYEFRDVKCEVVYHQPKNGMKTLIRSDNNKSFNEKMSDADYNLFTQAKEDNY